MQPGHEGVMGFEPAGERVDEVEDFEAQPSLGQRGEDFRVAFTLDEGVGHRPGRDPVRSEITVESLIPEPSRNPSGRWIFRVRSRVAIARDCFQHHGVDVFAFQELPQFKNLQRGCTPRGHGRCLRSGTQARDPQADLRVAFGDINPCCRS